MPEIKKARPTIAIKGTERKHSAKYRLRRWARNAFFPAEPRLVFGYTAQADIFAIQFKGKPRIFRVERAFNADPQNKRQKLFFPVHATTRKEYEQKRRQNAPKKLFATRHFS